MTTPPEPKATEPSDEELRAMTPDVGTVPFGDAALRAMWRAGFHSRDGEFSDLAARSKEQIVTLSRLNEQLCEERTWTVAHLEHWKACAAARYDMFAEKAAEVEALKAERDKLHAALEASQACWHCKVCLLQERPVCERCPRECDDEDCQAEGCTDGK